MKASYFLTFFFAFSIFFFTFSQFIYNNSISPAAEIVHINNKKIPILDAGHGGEDGGAVSFSGISESKINLAIVQKMNDILCFYGEMPILLRKEDISLHDSQAKTLREKKVSDLKNRVSTVNSVPNGILISIHQNTYPNENYSGGQTFYANTDGSQALAKHVQTTLKHNLQVKNERECKAIPDTVYLMNHVMCPAILIECGFLTNRAEEQLLLDSSYQKKLAMTLSSAWLTFDF